MNYDLVKMFPGFCPKAIYDVGFGIYQNNHYDYLNKDINFVFFEPNIFFYNDMVRKFSGYNNIKLYNVAIYENSLDVDFFIDGFNSFVGGVFSQSQKQLSGMAEFFLRYNKIRIPARRISDFDDGNVDFLSLDCEACEWFCLKHLKSRPEIIRFALTCEGGYRNPFFHHIEKWFKDNNYYLCYVHSSADCYYNYFYRKK